MLFILVFNLETRVKISDDSIYLLLNRICIEMYSQWFKKRKMV